MHSDFSNRTADLLGESCGGLGLGMGLAAQGDVLVYAGHLGNEPRGPAHGDHLLVDSDDGRPGRLGTMAAIRLALGDRGAEQHVVALFSPGIRLVGLVPSRKRRQGIDLRRGARFFRVLRVCISVAGSKLPDVWALHLHTRQLWSRASTRKRPRRGWDVDGISASHPGGVCHEAVPADGGTRVHQNAETAGNGLYQSGLRQVFWAVREAVRLFLGRTAKSHAAAMAE